jgi:hypothetical protein
MRARSPNSSRHLTGERDNQPGRIQLVWPDCSPAKHEVQGSVARDEMTAENVILCKRIVGRLLTYAVEKDANSCTMDIAFTMTDPAGNTLRVIGGYTSEDLLKPIDELMLMISETFEENIGLEKIDFVLKTFCRSQRPRSQPVNEMLDALDSTVAAQKQLYLKLMEEPCLPKGLRVATYDEAEKPSGEVTMIKCLGTVVGKLTPRERKNLFKMLKKTTRLPDEFITCGYKIDYADYPETYPHCLRISDIGKTWWLVSSQAEVERMREESAKKRQKTSK